MERVNKLKVLYDREEYWYQALVEAEDELSMALKKQLGGKKELVTSQGPMPMEKFIQLKQDRKKESIDHLRIINDLIKNEQRTETAIKAKDTGSADVGKSSVSKN